MLLRSLVFALLVVWTMPHSSFGSDTTLTLQASLARMKSWMGGTPQADGWRRYLLLNALETQAALGDRADLSTMNEILARFQSGVSGLEHPAFQDVRIALEEHSRHLANVRVGDVMSELAAAGEKFRLVEVTEVIRRRDDAVYQLELLEKNYRTRFVEPERSTILGNLHLAEALIALREIDPNQVIADGRAPNNGDDAQDQVRQRNRTEAIARLRSHVQRFDEIGRERFDAFFGSALLSLDKYFRALFYASDRDLKQGYLRQLQTLQENLPLLSDPMQRRAAGLVGNSLGWLEHAGQVPELVTAIRIRVSQPNLQGQIQGSFLNQLISREMPETRPVAEEILGRFIQGTSHLNTRVTLDLIDDPNQVAISIRALGNVHSDTFTRQGPVTAFSGSNGVYEARRHVYANVGGFYATDPIAAANLQSEFRGTDCRLRIVNKIANKTYWRDKTLSEGIAAGRAENQIRAQFLEQTTTSLENPKASLQRMLDRGSEYSRLVPDLFLNSHTDAVLVTAKRGDAFRLGAVGPAPGFSVPADVRFKIHESMLSNYLDPFFAGRTLTNEDMAKQAERILGNVPDALQAQKPEDNWSITFAPLQAVQAQIDENRILISVNGRRFTRADQQMRAAMIIRLAFKVVRENGQLMLIRDGAVTVDYENPADESARTLAFKTFLTDQLNAQGMDEKGLDLPANLIPTNRIEALQNSPLVANLNLVELTADNGWATVGWTYIPSGRYLQSPVHTPAIAEDGAPPVPPEKSPGIAPPTPDESN